MSRGLTTPFEKSSPSRQAVSIDVLKGLVIDLKMMKVEVAGNVSGKSWISHDLIVAP